ncbi:probable G-protein coupled receptor Mth-like 3 [Vanessa atalanta]|uniref:probable G-protein coupled receptor Mth-like 3 n=1 Tax=Vanessa atalanta TaxID=42275 RepID=UPI001FCCE489|nr:probable G-protein coupled receptor Mth-like 3 [Vanessa atalanta]
MKETIILLFSLIGLALSTNPCCVNDEIIRPRGFCGNATSKINMHCTLGHMLLKDVILNGYKVSTQDSPSYVFVEDPSLYCLGKMYKNTSDPNLGTIPVAVVCFEEIKSRSNNIETGGVLTLISVLFLLATFAVYMYMPQMRDLQGVCYMCMCASMALGFLSLGVLQLSPGFSGEICTISGFLVYFWMMATFFWMNVISINMYRTVEDASYLKKTEKKQYFIYNCYAWGCTIFFLIVALITNFAEGNHYKPGIGDNSCWFNGRTETWIFFYGPIAILIAVNVILFVMSSISLWRHTRKYEVNKLNNLKHKFLVSLKLFLVMGISWIFEIASFAHGAEHIIWKIMDTFNCLQGVVIFLILVVFRRRAIQGLASENCCLCITRPLAEKLSPHDDNDDQQILADDTVEVRLN